MRQECFLEIQLFFHSHVAEGLRLIRGLRPPFRGNPRFGDENGILLDLGRIERLRSLFRVNWRFSARNGYFA